MSKTTHIRFFNRDGTSQQQRALAEIDPLYAKIDDHQLKDLLSFLWKIAEYVNYYNIFKGNELRGKKIGIIGLGSIGFEVSKRLMPFDVEFLIYDPYVQEARLR